MYLDIVLFFALAFEMNLKNWHLPVVGQTISKGKSFKHIFK